MQIPGRLSLAPDFLSTFGPVLNEYFVPDTRCKHIHQIPIASWSLPPVFPWCCGVLGCLTVAVVRR